MTPGIVVACEQGTELWSQIRCGRITSSRTADAIGSKKVKGQLVETATREQYRVEILCERLTGIPYPHFESAEMRWGKMQEDAARQAYEMHAGVLVDVVGFVIHPTMPYFGSSPDFLVGDDGMGQIKCPATKTHLEWLRAGRVPKEHVAQLLSDLCCTGRAWIDFVSFDPRLPEWLQLFVVRYHRDDVLIGKLEQEIAHFNSEVGDELERLPGAPELPAAGIVGYLDAPRDDEPLEF